MKRKIRLRDDNAPTAMGLSFDKKDLNKVKKALESFECGALAEISEPNRFGIQHVWIDCTGLDSDELKDTRRFIERLKSQLRQSKAEKDSCIKDGTENFKFMYGMPLYAFNYMDDENQTSDYGNELDYNGAKKLNEELDELNDNLNDIAFDIEQSDNPTDEELDEAGRLRDLAHFEVRDGYYDGGQISTKYPDVFDELDSSHKNYVLKALDKIAKNAGLIETKNEPLGYSLARNVVYHNRRK